MGHLHISKIMFRIPVPDGSCSKAKEKRHQRQKTENSDCLPADSVVFFFLHIRSLIYLLFMTCQVTNSLEVL